MQSSLQIVMMIMNRIEHSNFDHIKFIINNLIKSYNYDEHGYIFILKSKAILIY